MFDVILFEPEIPPNTGNIIRLCANNGARLHLVKPLGFKLEDRQLQRAGLDYHEYASITLHENWEVCRDAFNGQRVFAVSTRGRRDTAKFNIPKTMLFYSALKHAGCLALSCKHLRTTVAFACR